jgi:hypothetical protein
MKVSILVLFCCCCVNKVVAQNQLTGSVRDGADGSPVPYATAALLRSDSSIVTGVMTGDDGRFVIENVTAGSYLLQVSFIGYEKEFRTVNVPSQSSVGEILLSESAGRLQEVVVTGRRALVVQQLDRVVVNVAGNMITSGLNIDDVLKRLPGLVVDESGNVKLNGRSATVYIDGRPTRLPPEQVTQMLRGMMGDVVDRVELIENPSSRYEAGLSLAIVNIRMKRDATLGINGTAQTGIGFTDYDFASRGGLNLNYRTKKLNIFGNYGYSNTPSQINLHQIRNYGGTMPVTYDHYSVRRASQPGHTLRAGMDWFVTPKQTIGFLFNGTFNERDGKINAQADIMRTGTSKIDSTELTDSKFTNKYSSQTYNLNYRLVIADNEELAVDADYGRVYNSTWQNMQSHDGSVSRSPTEFQYSGPRNIDILSLKMDYTKPVSTTATLETGFKTGQTITDNEILYENLIGGTWVNDNNQSNHFNYTERVSAAYTTYSQRLGKFSIMAGLRAEYTSVKGESFTMDTTFARSYLDWFPSAYVQYQLNDRHTLNLSYARKINRPEYSQLNPFRSYVDAYTIFSGNPNLNPSYSNTIGLRYSMGGYSANASYDIVNDLFSRDYVQDDVSHTMTNIPKNTGKRQGLTVSGFAPVQLTKWYSMQLSAQASWNMLDIYQAGERFQKDYLSANTSLQNTFTILPTLRAFLMVGWQKIGWQGILHFNDTKFMYAQIEKSFFDRRLNLTLSCNDPFKWGEVHGKMNFGNVNQTIKEVYNQRMTMLTVRYSFGSQQIRGARNRSVGIEEEMGRTR